VTAEELPPIDDLDDIFNLPENISDLRYRTMYEVIVSRLRREAAHLSMSTLQLLLIERIAFNYVVLRYKESQPMGTIEGFSQASVQKDFNTFWLSMTKELNASIRGTDTEFRKSFMLEAVGIMKDVIDTVEDPETRRQLRDRMVLRVEDAGL